MSLCSLVLTVRSLMGVLQYGEQWTDIKKRVPYRLIPFIY